MQCMFVNPFRNLLFLRNASNRWAKAHSVQTLGTKCRACVNIGPNVFHPILFVARLFVAIIVSSFKSSTLIGFLFFFFTHLKLETVCVLATKSHTNASILYIGYINEYVDAYTHKSFFSSRFTYQSISDTAFEIWSVVHCLWNRMVRATFAG